MAAILDEYERLTAEKSKLEAEIGAIVDELTSGSNPPGIKGPLVDADGFPRGDIDVYRVRHQRHAFAVAQYNHKAVMTRIEQILPQVFDAKSAKAKEAAGADMKPPSPPDVKPVVAVAESKAPAAAASFVPKEIDAADKAKKPFAIVENVQNDSPAEWADLHAADQVVVFGTADATNNRNLEAIKEIVMHNIGSPIRVIVRRVPLGKTGTETGMAAEQAADQWEFHELLLTPQQWRGAGVLGCLLMPVQNDEQMSSP